MIQCSLLQIILDIIVTIGTIAVAILAIWGDWFRDKLVAPELVIHLKNKKGFRTKQIDGEKVIYYHLVVKNNRKWAMARGVQVMLVSVWLQAADGEYIIQPQASELPLAWTYAQFTPLAPNISDEQICDLGYLCGDRFSPKLLFTPNDFNGCVKENQTVRYSIRVKAENFTSGKMLVIEVSWDGNWSDDSQQMERHLVVKEIIEEKT